jgi:hypothetical protein
MSGLNSSFLFKNFNKFRIQWTIIVTIKFAAAAKTHFDARRAWITFVPSILAPCLQWQSSLADTKASLCITNLLVHQTDEYYHHQLPHVTDISTQLLLQRSN